MKTPTEIQNKIAELLRINEEEIDHPNYWEKSKARMEKQQKLLDELKELARKHKTFIGRALQFGVADGYAIYLITHVNRGSVQTVWIDFCDGYADETVEAYGGTLPFAFAKKKIEGQDWLEKTFSKK